MCVDTLATPDTFKRLVMAVQELSLARNLEQITAVVRRTARALAASDGATFVLRDGGCCYYVDEDAIAPLWKGRRFPMEICISGWVMLNRQPVVISDIYSDDRIPHQAYQPTFVQSLAVVPIRTLEPIGAIGVYWSRQHTPTPDEVGLLSALADSSAVALENVQMHNVLEQAHIQAPPVDASETLSSVQGFDELAAGIAETSAEVRAAVSNFRRLEKIVRMCAWTKRLELGGEWLSIESYLERRFGIEVTHGISEEALSALEAKLEHQG